MSEIWTIYFLLVFMPNEQPVKWQENYWAYEDCEARYESLKASGPPRLGDRDLDVAFTPCVRR